MQCKFSAPVETVYASLTDPDFLEQRCLDLGEISATCKVKKSAGGHSVNMKRQVERELPSFLAKLFNPVQTIVINEVWRDDDDGGKEATYTLEVVGQPVEVSAEITLRPSGKGSVYEIKHRAKVRIPLIGGQIERFVLGQTEAGCEEELDYTVDALKGGERKGGEKKAAKASGAGAKAAKAGGAKKAAAKKRS